MKPSSAAILAVVLLLFAQPFVCHAQGLGDTRLLPTYSSSARWTQPAMLAVQDVGYGQERAIGTTIPSSQHTPVEWFDVPAPSGRSVGYLATDAVPNFSLRPNPIIPVQHSEPYVDSACVDGDCYELADCTDGCLGDPGCRTDVCCDPKWKFFGEFLWLRPGNEKISYAVPVNSLIAPGPVQAGPDAVADIGFNPGVRAGFSRALDEYASLGVTYTFYEGDTTDQITVPGPNPVIRSKVNHPGAWAVPNNYLLARADYGIDFDLADLVYRRMLFSDSLYAVHYVIGARYGHLGQQFNSVFSNVATIETVNTDLTFDGGGIRLGLEAERHAACSGWMIYGRGDASFIGGQFRGRYLQADNFRGNVVTAGWTEDRVVPILDLELGFGWANARDSFRLTAGYMFNAWYNVITTDKFISAVQRNDSVAVADTITFDGLVVRAEFRH